MRFSACIHCEHITIKDKPYATVYNYFTNRIFIMLNKVVVFLPIWEQDSLFLFSKSTNGTMYHVMKDLAGEGKRGLGGGKNIVKVLLVFMS